MSDGRRILIVEDTDHLRLVLRATLEFKGYTVSEAVNGQEALAVVAAALSEPAAALSKPAAGSNGGAAAFDLIFCDIEMPVMNGLEFVRRFRAQYGPETPILMLTAEEGETLHAALAAGADAIIHKPFEPIKLLDELQRRLG